MGCRLVTDATTLGLMSATEHVVEKIFRPPGSVGDTVRRKNFSSTKSPTSPSPVLEYDYVKTRETCGFHRTTNRTAILINKIGICARKDS